MRTSLVLLTFALLGACTPEQVAPQEPSVQQASASASSVVIGGTERNPNVYLVSPDGNDANDGHSPYQALKTVARASQIVLQPGQAIRFRAGYTFEGTLKVQGQGTPGRPIVVGSYSQQNEDVVGAPATLTVSSGDAIDFNGVSNINVDNLKLVGTGNARYGINIYSIHVPVTHSFVRNSDISGFGMGISVRDSLAVRIDSLLVENCKVHDNAGNGMLTWTSQWPAIPNTNYIVRGCEFYRNAGNGNTSIHSGSGVIMSAVDGGLIENCVAYENGSNSGWQGGGPMAIWCYDARNVIIQFNEAHHNYSSKNVDGGGFDIDGGSSYCIMQYNYSHDNEGEGYGLFEYGSPNPWTNNIMRWNVSDNDGTKLGYSVGFWATNGKTLLNSRVYNNTIVRASTALHFSGSNAQNVSINNTLVQAQRTFGGTTPLTGFDIAKLYDGPFTLVNGYHLPAGSPLSTAGNHPGSLNELDFYQQPLNGAFPIGASK